MTANEKVEQKRAVNRFIKSIGRTHRGWCAESGFSYWKWCNLLYGVRRINVPQGHWLVMWCEDNHIEPPIRWSERKEKWLWVVSY